MQPMNPTPEEPTVAVGVGSDAGSEAGSDAGSEERGIEEGNEFTSEVGGIAVVSPFVSIPPG